MSANGHAARIYQPSQFKRTMGCPGWGNFCEANKLKSSPSSKYAMEGSIAHDLGETCLNENHDAEKYLGYWGWCNAKGGTGIGKAKPGKGELSAKPNLLYEIDDEMADAVQVYLDGIRAKRDKSTGAEFGVEKKLDLSWLIPGMYGTGDHTITEPLGLLSVDDYKHGQGVLVSAGSNVGENVQCSIYGLGSIGEDNPNMVEEVESTIWQPRSRHTTEQSSSARFSAEDLIQWGYDVLVPAAKKAEDPDAPLIAGDWCLWCDAEKALGSDGKYLCPARRQQQVEAANLMFKDEGAHELTTAQETITPVPAAELSAEQLDRALFLADMMETWVKAVKAEGFDRHDKGHPEAPMNFKMVQGQMGNRKWADEATTIKEMIKTMTASEIYDEKVKSPAQMENALKKFGKKPADAKAMVTQLTTRPPGKKILVPADDKRPAVAGSLDEMFND